SAPVTDSQNCCESRSPRPAGTHAARPARPAWPIQDRSSTVLPLPGGADTTITRAGAASRPNGRGRATTPPAPGPTTPPATASDPTADPMLPIIAPHPPTRPQVPDADTLTDARHPDLPSALGPTDDIDGQPPHHPRRTPLSVSAPGHLTLIPKPHGTAAV